ncbi:transcriptional regulator, BlaI/MecI/CopY family [Desulfitobacterium hafniense DP7]|nr:transcriptional regulator, BlaI/MecI/CopY family [Desulfitobacterium hafniense DP7]
MEILWNNEPINAAQLSVLATEKIGWNKNTTYTIINKLIKKQVILRTEPGFVCSSLIKKEDVKRAETELLIKRLFDGSKLAFFAAFLENETLSEQELSELRALIEKK